MITTPSVPFQKLLEYLPSEAVTNLFNVGLEAGRENTQTGIKRDPTLGSQETHGRPGDGKSPERGWAGLASG